ncbi:protein nessun dorma isoform X1 [Anopheles aquasalis]|uniref:protein nessun dorma isoform X1 n=1 Tax=Anopheles aquasalis TaxID=42839 RepID=UPI00215A142E|nr:protein nessun dorma isoform X1 [Anopheles aquasalis]XP_050088744.1 protein nessun dorma isoform X1 [Anopheles aquasalis]
MEVYEFNKTLLTRLMETRNVLNGSGGNVRASEIRSEWISYIEVVVEPTGWQALWKASRAVCEKLSVKYPLLVLGTVDQVLFDELQASFIVEAIQDDDVQLLEKELVVDLEELWPLREQNNPALNVTITADCIDKLRFFYQNLWMPWDGEEQDDHGWVENHLESRIRLCHDLKKKTMSWQLSSHVMSLLAEARYIQRKLKLWEDEEAEREELEAENEEKELNDASILENERSCDLLKLNMRLAAIKNEMEILENPAMRPVFEKVRFGNDKNITEQSRLAFIVTQIDTVENQLVYLERTKRLIDGETQVKLCESLQHALDHCSPDSAIYLPAGTRQNIKFLAYLNSGGSFRGVGDANFLEDHEQAVKSNPTIASKDDDSVLLTIDGDFTLENIHFDCSNVRTGVMVKEGNVLFRNCCFTGDPTSSTKQGVVVFGNCKLTFENCLIKEFSTGIYSNSDCTIRLVNTTIQKCVNGMEVLDQCMVHFETVTIRECQQYGVLLEDFNEDLETTNGPTARGVAAASNSSQVYEDFNMIDREEFSFAGRNEFHSNAKGNFVIRKVYSSRFNSSCFIEEIDADGTFEDAGDDTLQQDRTACNNTNVSFGYDVPDASLFSSTKQQSLCDENGTYLKQNLSDDHSTNDTGLPGSLTHSEEDAQNDGDEESNSYSERDTAVFEHKPFHLSRRSPSNSPEQRRSFSSQDGEDSVCVIEIEDTIIEID